METQNTQPEMQSQMSSQNNGGDNKKAMLIGVVLFIILLGVSAYFVPALRNAFMNLFPTQEERIFSELEKIDTPEEKRVSGEDLINMLDQIPGGNIESN
ncbi:MAG: hypothetical protein ACJKSS_02775 [Patescibacteria group bacterium UBA2103]